MVLILIFAEVLGLYGLVLHLLRRDKFLRPYHAFQTYHCPDNELKSRRHQNLLDLTVNLACL